jgi:hypothetical protein
MQRLYISRILAVLALLSCLLPSFGVGVAWFCEGRQCGVSLWTCCCMSPDALRDSNCGTTLHANDIAASEKTTFSDCPAGCNCVMVSAETPASNVVPSVSLLVPPIALLPLPAPIYCVAPVEKPLVYGRETRGPPRQPLVFANLSLRAPPVA